MSTDAASDGDAGSEGGDAGGDPAARRPATSPRRSSGPASTSSTGSSRADRSRRPRVRQARRLLENSLLAEGPEEHRNLGPCPPRGARDDVIEVVQRKPVRTASGVSPVAIMTSPKLCPHGKCLYCPGGPARSSPRRSRTRATSPPRPGGGEQNDYDPYGQVTLRLEQLRKIGHPVDKVELILMGGTMTRALTTTTTRSGS